MKRALFLLLAGASLLATAASDLDGLADRFRARLLKGRIPTVGARRLVQIEVDNCSLPRLLEGLRADGSWEDVDYVTNERGYWPAAIGHCGRLCRLASLLGNAGTPSPEGIAAFHRALGWWLANDLQNSNWWWNVIGVPQDLAEACLMFPANLTEEELRGVIRILHRADESEKKPSTGQNRVWRARITLMRALLERDEPQARRAVAMLADEIFLSDREGIRSDWCFHQHGRQPQFGNYGLSYVLNMTSLAGVLAGTSYAFPPEKTALLRGLLANGYRWICWKGRMDVSAMGRQIVPGAQRVKGEATELVLAEFAASDPSFPIESPVGFRFFDKSAYAVYRTADWMASVRMASRDVVGVETTINSENVLGGHLADGMLMVYVTGREYEDLPPLWSDWRMLPGITSCRGLPPARNGGAKLGRERGTNDSDDVRGAGGAQAATVSMELKKEGLRALKSWRFTPDAILCEGREISGSDPAHAVVTTVEQAWAAPDVEIFPPQGGLLKVLNGTVGYVVEADASACHRTVERRKGDFKSINPNQPSHPVEGNVLSIWIDHGVRPSSGSYRYWVLPCVTRARLLAFDGRNPDGTAR